MSSLVATPSSSDKKTHPWRRCSVGQHFVREHYVHTPSSKKNPNGKIIIRQTHCAANRSHKDELTYDEFQYITKTYFTDFQGPPTQFVLTKKYPKADDYDSEIRGWTK